MNRKIAFSVALLFTQLSVSFAQTLPSDGLLPGPSGTTANDTIIRSNGPVYGTGSHAPAYSDVVAIYRHSYILINSTARNGGFYRICNHSLTTEMQGQALLTSSSPLIIDISTLPSGHYTLFLYINKECLEGEFYKE